MNKAAETLKLLGNAAAILSLFILMGFTVFLFVITHTDDADIFPSPISYLDAQRSSQGNMFYAPINGEMFCLGDEVLWEKNATFTRSTRIQRGYYLQIERPYTFTGPMADKLNERYGEYTLTTQPLHSYTMPSTHVTEGFFDGGIQSYTLPDAEELRMHSGIKPGDNLRIYVDVEAPFSQATGYHIPIVVGPDCPAVAATARQGKGERVFLGVER